MNKSGLIVRLAIVVTFSALAIGLVISQVFFRLTYLSELEAGKVEIKQLYNTISSTASIAAYLVDEELTNEVVTGLSNNDLVQSVAIKTQGYSITSKNFSENKQSQTFPLFSPFEPSQQIGTLIITPNILVIEQRAKDISWDNQISIAIQAAIIVMVIVFVAYVIVTQPIISVAQKLHKIVIGSDDRIPLPTFHKKSEIGLLVGDINLLLEKTEQQISEERKLRLQVEKLSRHFKLLFENSNSPIVLCEPNGDIILYNQAFISLLERIKIPLKQNFGVYLKELFNSPDDLDYTVEHAFKNNEIASGEFKINYHQGEHSIWMQTIVSSAITEDFREYYQITLHDISQRRLEIEQLDIKAHTDQLTQLLNRRGAKQELVRLMESNVEFALLLLDLNKFKPINDIYGHDAGDEILNYIASQLTKCLRRRDILSRWGGDEFVVILPELKQQEVLKVCEKIIKAIEKPHFLSQSNTTVSVGASIGVTYYQQNQLCELDTLIQQADKAMYRVKEARDKQLYVMAYQDL